jgi:hypothetical protein
MKKILMLLLCTTIFTFVSCEDEPFEGDLVGAGASSCATAAGNTAQAAINFAAVNEDTYPQLCAAYRDALEAQIIACGDTDGNLQLAVDALGDCTDQNQQATDVEGTWLLTAWIGDEPIDLNNDGVESDNFLNEMDCYNNETILFSDGGTGVIMSTSYAEFMFDILVGTTNEFDYTIDCIEEDENTNFTWTQTGNTVAITDDFGTTNVTIIGNQISIFVPNGFIAFSSEDVEVTTIQNLTFVYTKQ